MGNRFREKVVEEGLEEPQAASADATEAGQTDTAEANEEPTRNDGRRRRTARGIGRVLGGDILADQVVVRQIPLLLLCLMYLLLIVGNRYRIESLSRELQTSQERVNYLREQQIQMQKQYQQSVKISQIAEDLRERGVGITAGPPYRLEK